MSITQLIDGTERHVITNTGISVKSVAIWIKKDQTIFDIHNDYNLTYTEIAIALQYYIPE